MKSFFANTTINFEGSKFYVRPGDLLSYDVQHDSSLAVYRTGQLVKVLKVEALAIQAFVKSRFITEVRPPAKEAPVMTKARAGAYPSDMGVAVVEGKLRARAFNDLGNTPASQADMDVVARQHDELVNEPPKQDKKKKKSQDAAKIDFAVHPQPLPPTQIQSTNEPVQEPEQNRISA